DKHVRSPGVEAEIARLWPHVVPLGCLPFGKARDHVAMRAEGENIAMKQWPRGRVVDVAHVAGEALEPIDEILARCGVRVGQRSHLACSSQIIARLIMVSTAFSMS